MQSIKLQIEFLKLIEAKLSANERLVDALQNDLGLSKDAAYRRINGTIELSFIQAHKLSSKYGVPMQANQETEHSYFFNYLTIEQKVTSLQDSLSYIKNLFAFSKLTGSVYHISNDISLFQLLQVPEIAAFKLFFFSKTTHSIQDLKDVQFSLADIMQHYKELVHQVKAIANLYIATPTTEILGANAVYFLVQQIKYYQTAGYFAHSNDAQLLLNKVIELLKHYKKQTELGYKFAFGLPETKGGTLEVFHNAIMNVNNIVLAKTNDGARTIISTNGLNFLSSSSVSLYNRNLIWAKTLQSKSVSLSLHNELQREQYFNELIQSVRETLT